MTPRPTPAPPTVSTPASVSPASMARTAAIAPSDAASAPTTPTLPVRRALYSAPRPRPLPGPAVGRYGIGAGVGRVSPTVRATIGTARARPKSMTPASVGPAPIIRVERVDASRAAGKHGAASRP